MVQNSCSVLSYDSLTRRKEKEYCNSTGTRQRNLGYDTRRTQGLTPQVMQKSSRLAFANVVFGVRTCMLSLLSRDRMGNLVQNAFPQGCFLCLDRFLVTGTPPGGYIVLDVWTADAGTVKTISLSYTPLSFSLCLKIAFPLYPTAHSFLLRPGT